MRDSICSSRSSISASRSSFPSTWLAGNETFARCNHRDQLGLPTSTSPSSRRRRPLQLHPLINSRLPQQWQTTARKRREGHRGSLGRVLSVEGASSSTADSAYHSPSKLTRNFGIVGFVAMDRVPPTRETVRPSGRAACACSRVTLVLTRCVSFFSFHLTRGLLSRAATARHRVFSAYTSLTLFSTTATCAEASGREGLRRIA